MSANPEYVVPLPADGSKGDATLRDQRELVERHLARSGDAILTTDSAPHLVPKLQLQLGNEMGQAARALEVSEVRYRRLFETAQDAILVLDAGTGKIIDANPFVRDLLGYSHDELLSLKSSLVALLRRSSGGTIHLPATLDSFLRVGH